MLILTLLTGVAAHGLLVYAQRTIQIGTIGIAQVVQPALAVVWSFLLLGETLGDRAGRGDRSSSWSGCSAFLCAQRAPSTRLSAACRTQLSVGPVVLGDEVRGDVHPAVRLGAEVAGRGLVARRGGQPAERVEREDLDVGRVVRGARPPGSRRDGPPRREPASAASRAASRHSPRAACSPPPDQRCQAVAASSAVRALPEVPLGAQDPTEVDPRQSGQPYVAGRLGLVDRPSRRVAAPRVVVAGLALCSAQARELVGLGLQEAEPARGLGRAEEVDDGVVEAPLDAGQLSRGAPRRGPAARGRPPTRSQSWARPTVSTLRSGSPAEIAARAANSALAAWSQGRSSES